MVVEPESGASIVTLGGTLGSYLLPEFVIIISVICPFLIKTDACA